MIGLFILSICEITSNTGEQEPAKNSKEEGETTAAVRTYDEVSAFYILMQFMHGPDVNWQEVFSPGYRKLK